MLRVISYKAGRCLFLLKVLLSPVLNLHIGEAAALLSNWNCVPSKKQLQPILSPSPEDNSETFNNGKKLALTVV